MPLHSATLGRRQSVEPMATSLATLRAAADDRPMSTPGVVVAILAIELLVVAFAPRAPAYLLLNRYTRRLMSRRTVASVLTVLLMIAIVRLP